MIVALKGIIDTVNRYFIDETIVYVDGWWISDAEYSFKLLIRKKGSNYMIATLVVIYGLLGIVYCIYWISCHEKDDSSEFGFLGILNPIDFQKKYKHKPPY